MKKINLASKRGGRLFEPPDLEKEREMLLNYFFNEFLPEDAEDLNVHEGLAELVRVLKKLEEKK